MPKYTASKRRKDCLNRQLNDFDKQIIEQLISILDNSIYKDNSKFYCCFLEEEVKVQGAEVKTNICIGINAGMYNNIKTFHDKVEELKDKLPSYMALEKFEINCSSHSIKSYIIYLIILLFLLKWNITISDKEIKD